MNHLVGCEIPYGHACSPNDFGDPLDLSLAHDGSTASAGDFVSDTAPLFLWYAAGARLWGLFIFVTCNLFMYVFVVYFDWLLGLKP